ncbi:transport system permease protein [Tolumonas auensis DSM 9187]|uniref:Transport system permease protein n=1 Tax=Tolumonas auensis (strain DSM 9187 / NBRC 110442 / TA 4) TaxID=595494 RepID=C4LAV0_TOLAT|nr:iron chelate uptake ABC transporter family permease subunit [Tolumonas auensis]ACQ92304.1 transport system permease protein [Tolumonas auensis DSM 9187]
MRDSVKMWLLLFAGIAFTAYFLGKGLTADNYSFFLANRIPKVLAIMIASVAIATSSLVFQTITNNQILTPSILGFDALYVMIQSIILIIFGSSSYLLINPLLNFSVATAIMVSLSMGLFLLYFQRKNTNLFSLLLIGIVCGSLFSSMTNFFTLIVDPAEFSTVQRAMFASFNNVNGELVYWSLIPLLLAVGYLWRLAARLDVLWLGIDNARSLGIDTRKVMMQVMLLISVLISVATALVGPVLFLGLIVVSLTRQLFRSYHHRFLMLASTLLSVVLLTGGQWFIESMLDLETTISVIINFIGGSYFLLLLMRNKVQ